MTVGLLPAIRGGLGELAKTGQVSRLVDGYLKPYARAFGDVRYFSYLDESLTTYTTDPDVTSRVRLYPGASMHPWAYAFMMPLRYRALFETKHWLKSSTPLGRLSDTSLLHQPIGSEMHRA